MKLHTASEMPRSLKQTAREFSAARLRRPNIKRSKHQDTKKAAIQQLLDGGLLCVLVSWRPCYFFSGYLQRTIVPSSSPRLFSSQEYSMITSLPCFRFHVRTLVQSCVYITGS